MVQSIRKVISFGDSIPRGTRIHQFNWLVKKNYAKMKSFPGVTSNKLLHYMDPTLKDRVYNTAVIHVWVKDLLNNKNTTWIRWIRQQFEKCGNKMYFERYSKKLRHLVLLLIKKCLICLLIRTLQWCAKRLC